MGSTQHEVVVSDGAVGLNREQASALLQIADCLTDLDYRGSRALDVLDLIRQQVSSR